MGIRLCAGYSGKMEDLKKLAACPSRLKSVYAGGVDGMFAGGRPLYMGSRKDLGDQVVYAHNHDMKFEVALNAPVNVPEYSDTQWWRALKTYLRELSDLGVDGVIVSQPLVMEAVKTETDMQLIVSTICEVMTARGALYYEKMGADVIIPSMNANMNPDELLLMNRSLKHAKLRIMVNERCLGDCPWRKAHFDQVAERAHNRTYNYDRYFLNCHRMFHREPHLLLANNAIRPEDLVHYENITQDFKIVGRQAPIADTLLRIRAYSEGSFDGNYVRLLVSRLAPHLEIPNKALDGLIEKKWSCSKICSECNHCRKLFEAVGRFVDDA
jgi:collagenase-like PrtC family protease